MPHRVRVDSRPHLVHLIFGDSSTVSNLRCFHRQPLEGGPRTPDNRPMLVARREVTTEGAPLRSASFMAELSINELSGWYKSLYRSHRGPLCKKDDVQKTFHRESLLPRFPD
jgi:hypothetical protein